MFNILNFEQRDLVYRFAVSEVHVAARFPSGDHSIFTAEVVHGQGREDKLPLLDHGGKMFASTEL